MEPIISWIGNKEREADLLVSLFPSEIRNYYEPFVGSGSVFLKVKAREYYINDRCRELAELYRAVKGNRGRFYRYLECFADAWTNIDLEYFLLSDYLISAYKAFRTEQTNFTDMNSEVAAYLSRIPYERIFSIRLTDNYSFEMEKRFWVVKKFISMHREESAGGSYDDAKILKKLRTALKCSVYAYLQNIYNRHKELDDLRTALFYFLMSYNASSAYLMDKHHEFRVPYIGEKGNDKHLDNRILELKNPALREQLNVTYIGGSDFATFLTRTKPRKEDFIFIDPPEPGNYIQNGGWEFSPKDYDRLQNYIHFHCSSRWMMVLRNTEKMRDIIFGEEAFAYSGFNKYNLKLVGLEDENATHIIVCNYCDGD